MQPKPSNTHWVSIWSTFFDYKFHFVWEKQYCNLFSEVSCVQMAFMQQCFIQLYMHRTLSSGIFEMFVCFNLMLAMDHTEFCTLFASYRYQQRGARNSIRMLKVISHIPWDHRPLLLSSRNSFETIPLSYCHFIEMIQFPCAETEIGMKSAHTTARSPALPRNQHICQTPL